MKNRRSINAEQNRERGQTLAVAQCSYADNEICCNFAIARRRRVNGRLNRRRTMEDVDRRWLTSQTNHGGGALNRDREEIQLVLGSAVSTDWQEFFQPALMGKASRRICFGGKVEPIALSSSSSSPPPSSASLERRLLKEDLIIDCSDQGVEFFEAKVNLKLEEFLSLGPEKLELLHHFVPYDIGSSLLPTTPMLAIQVTVFECGGLVICFHASHAITDGFTAITFIHSWAKACRLGIGEMVRPSFDLPLLFPSRDISGETVNRPNLTGRVKVVTKIFVFDAAKIAELKDKLIGGSGEDRKPSRVEVVVTALWKALILASRARNEEKLRNSVVSLSANIRGRTGLPTPENLIGNFYVVIPTTFEPEHNTPEPNHIHLLGLLRESMRKSLATLAKLSDHGEISSAGLNFHNHVAKSTLDENVDLLKVTSWSRFPFYETDFGWGKPCWVNGACFPLELVVLFDTKCGTGSLGGLERAYYA
ncbi:hypothetical protein Vadar_002137 [Vaccinium darrowii]|uniref:Uncharacterized protein n=1 Tax=Vaccinium darrowii TaxID=229202 RepID=A0ACB7WX87_9ERIC|nr:hypothetical protein Vadar_002137 [Vaccinium darrowii]